MMTIPRMIGRNSVTAPVTSRQLEARASAIIAEWIMPSYTQPFEYIRASANNQGEIHLRGLVHDQQLTEEAVRRVQDIPGVRCVYNDISILCSGCAIEL